MDDLKLPPALKNISHLGIYFLGTDYSIFYPHNQLFHLLKMFKIKITFDTRLMGLEITFVPSMVQVFERG
jgi:hypothetical protein